MDNEPGTNDYNIGDDTDLGPFISLGVSTTGATYYVDATKGDDRNDGCSPQKPWKTLDAVSSRRFLPGDHILLESSGHWKGERLAPQGSGKEGQPIVLDCYTRTSDGGAVYAACRRPVIDGCGTKNVLGSFERYISGAVQLTNQEYWSIRNLEVSNTPDLLDLDGYKRSGDAQRAGILLLGFGLGRSLAGLTVENTYVHDVQTEDFTQACRRNLPAPLKPTGGIIVLSLYIDPDGKRLGEVSDTGFRGLTLRSNIVERVGLEGIRTKAESSTGIYPRLFKDLKIVGNYLEDVAGDAIVASEVADGALVEGNVVVRACAADYGTQNYAALWVMASHDVLVQYNEVYGNVYGYNDAEAFDIDMQCSDVTYQYNYSHGNGGGFMLLMSDQTNSTVRYNISANDGGGNRGTGADGGDGCRYEYAEQSLFHYSLNEDSAATPRIYNNTFYVGDGVSTSLFGEGSSADDSGVIAHFSNNIVCKAGSGTVCFLSNYPPDGSPARERALHRRPSDFLTHNLFSTTTIAGPDSGVDTDDLVASGNVFADPKLRIGSEPEGERELNRQLITVLCAPETRLPDQDYRLRLRRRVRLFEITGDSPAVAQGLRFPDSPDKDFFGNSTVDRIIDAGTHQVSNRVSTRSYTMPCVRVATAVGVYPLLPASLEIRVRSDEDGHVMCHMLSREIIWNLIDPASYACVGSFTVEGVVAGLDSVKAQAVVTVVDESETQPYVLACCVADVTVRPGQQPALPDTVTVKLSDGTYEAVPVTWPGLDSLAPAVGKYRLVAAMNRPGGPVVAAISVRQVEVVSLESLPPVLRPVGVPRAQLGLPQEVSARLSDGTSLRLAIAGWDDDPGNYTENRGPGIYRFPGALSLPTGVSNPRGLKPVQEVHVCA